MLGDKRHKARNVPEQKRHDDGIIYTYPQVSQFWTTNP